MNDIIINNIDKINSIFDLQLKNDDKNLNNYFSVYNSKADYEEDVNNDFYEDVVLGWACKIENKFIFFRYVEYFEINNILQE